MPPRLVHWLRHLPAVLGVALLVGAIYVVQREFRSLRIEDIVQTLDAMPIRGLARAFGFTILSYGVLTLYDRLGTIYAGHKVSYARVALASFCAYALSHNLGFAAVSGAAVRYRLYAYWGLSALEIGKVVAFCSLTFGLGGMVLGGSILLVEPTAVPYFGNRLPPEAIRGVGAALVMVVVGYVALARVLGRVRLFGHVIGLPGIRMALLQVLVATADVAVTAAIFFTLLPDAPALTYQRFLAVYLASYSAGLAANLPGGIGVFDSAMLLGLSPYLDAPHIVGAIVIFRLYYYVIPLFLAGALFAGNEVLLRSRVVLHRRAAATTGRWSEPDFAVAVATGAVTLCGAMLLSFGVLDMRPDLSWIDPDLVGMADEAGRFLPSVIGAALLVLAVGMSQRVTLAWGATIVLLLAAAVVTFMQGDRIWVPAALILATFLIAPFRSAFYRHARLFREKLDAASAMPLVALIVCLLMLSNFERHVRGLTDASWWQIVLSPELPNSLRLSLLLAVAVGLAAIWGLIRPGQVRALPWGAEARLRYAALGGEPPASADGIVLGEVERAAIPFRRVGRVLLGLGDPAGAETDRISAIWRLRDLARQEGLDPAFYDAGEALLKVYGDIGLAALPLGADGLPCDGHDEAAARQHAGRYLVCRAERDLSTLLPLLPALAEARAREAAD